MNTNTKLEGFNKAKGECISIVWNERKRLEHEVMSGNTSEETLAALWVISKVYNQMLEQVKPC